MKKRIVLIASLLCLSLALSGCAANNGNVAQSGGAAYAAATTQDVKAALKDSSAIVIDARSASAYSGWATGDNTRAGTFRVRSIIPLVG